MRAGNKTPVFLLVLAILLASGCTGDGGDAPLQATVSGLPEWTAGQQGIYPITAQGGTPPYACAVTAGALPPGFILANCILDGTPPLLAPGSTKSVSPPFTITITDSAGRAVSLELAIIVKQPSLTLQLTPVLCFVDQMCQANMIAGVAGGTPPYHYQSDTFREGTPPWGTVVGIDGLLIGIPTTEGTYTFGVCAVDLVGLSVCEKETAVIEKLKEVEPVEEVYAGTFSVRGNYDRAFQEYYTTCTFDDTFGGTISLTVIEDSSGALSGTASVDALFTSYGIAGSTAGFTCLDSQVPWADSPVVSGTASSLQFSTGFFTAGGNPYVGAFAGSKSGDFITGNIEFTSTCCSGSASSAVTLSKQ
ncbi:MAG: putative Ig domain-containing protein [archaeon]